VLPLPYQPGDRVVAQLHVDENGDAVVRISRVDFEKLVAMMEEREEPGDVDEL
jgi:hypothetical protein